MSETTEQKTKTVNRYDLAYKKNKRLHIAKGISATSFKEAKEKLEHQYKNITAFGGVVAHIKI